MLANGETTEADGGDTTVAPEKRESWAETIARARDKGARRQGNRTRKVIAQDRDCPLQHG